MSAADTYSGKPTPSPFASIGPALLASGFSPIPIRPDGKMPGAYAGGQWHIMRAWSKYCGEFPDPFSMKNWAKWPSANVGVALGRGVIGFDIDREDMVAAILAVLPPVLVAKKGRKGLTAFYRADTSTIRSRGFKIDGFGVMDLIADGKQTVLPPSIHPDTHEPYVWTTERTLADTRPEELPECTPEHFEAVLAVLTAHGWHEEKAYTVIPGERGDADSDKTEISEFYRKLNEDALANLAAWVPRLGLSRLHPTGDSYRSVAEWRPSNTGKPLHKRNMLLSINSKGIVDYGDCEKGYTPINLVMAAHEMADFQRDKAVVWLGDLLGYNWAPAMVLNRKAKPAGHVKPQRPGTEPVEIAASAPAAPVEAVDEDEPPPEPGEAWPAPLAFPGDEEARTPNVVSIPVKFDESPKPVSVAARREAELESLTRVPGLVGDMVDWIDASSTFPNRTLALAATLVFLGTLAGRLYKSPSGLRTNLYALGLAPSGHGKDHARKCLDAIDIAGGFSAWFGGDGIASASGMRKRVEHHAAIMWKIDEFGGFMRKISDPRAGQHVAQIRDNLLKYHSTAGSVFRGEDYAGEPGRPCYHPNVSLYGTATPTDFFDACRSLSARDGFLARIVIFSVGAKGRPKRVRPSANYEEPPHDLVEACRLVATPKCGGNIANMMDGSRPSKPLTVPYGPGAETFVENMIDALSAKADKASSDVEPFYQRVAEHAITVALIIAIGIDADRPVLTLECLRRGRAIVETCLMNAADEIRGRLADNDRQREHIDVRRWIEEAGPKGLSKTQLSIRINGRFDARRRDDILKTLETDEKLIGSILVSNPRGGAKGYRFIASRFLDGGEAA